MTFPQPGQRIKTKQIPWCTRDKRYMNKYGCPAKEPPVKVSSEKVHASKKCKHWAVFQGKAGLKNPKQTNKNPNKTCKASKLLAELLGRRNISQLTGVFTISKHLHYIQVVLWIGLRAEDCNACRQFILMAGYSLKAKFVCILGFGRQGCHRITEVDRELWTSSCPALLLRAGCSELSPSKLLTLWRMETPTVSLDSLLQCLINLTIRKVFLHLQRVSSLSACAHCFLFFTRHHWEEAEERGRITSLATLARCCLMQPRGCHPSLPQECVGGQWPPWCLPRASSLCYKAPCQQVRPSLCWVME